VLFRSDLGGTARDISQAVRPRSRDNKGDAVAVAETGRSAMRQQFGGYQEPPGQVAGGQKARDPLKRPAGG